MQELWLSITMIISYLDFTHFGHILAATQFKCVKASLYSLLNLEYVSGVLPYRLFGLSFSSLTEYNCTIIIKFILEYAKILITLFCI